MSVMNNFQTIRSKQAVIFVCLFSLCTISWGQSPVDTLVKKFGSYRNEHLQEKIFVHLDGTVHLCGETIWFKVYSVNGTTHQPLNLSKVVYVEILSANNESVMQGKVELTNGTGDGSFFLPATLNTGNYVLRAYTQWMRNYDTEFFFHQPITIINPFKSNEHSSIKQEVTYDAQFLPEGGNLVDGVTSTIGFRVTNTSGKGIDFKGAIVNTQGDTLARFTPTQFGIGSFKLTPVWNETYKAVITDRMGNVKFFPFPKVFAEGYTLHVERKGDEIQVEAQAKLSGQTSSAVHLLVHTRNQIIETTSGTLTNGKITFIISRNKLEPGISHITLFDDKLNPVCERLIFKSPNKRLIITPQTNESLYANREAVNLTLTATSEINLQETANLSVSVYKVDSLPSADQNNISTYMLLSSDLHGSVESPQTYFKLNSDESFDQLMLTHGWRRFSWDNILKGTGSPKFFPEALGLTVSGKLTTEEGKPASNVHTFLSSPARNNLFFTTRSKRNGDLHFILKNVYGTRKIILQTNFLRDSLFQFKLESPFSKSYSNIPLSPLNIDPSFEKTLIEKSMSMQVQDIFAKEPVPQAFFSSDTTAFYGKADETYFLDDYTRFSVMEEVMREYVPGVLVRKRKGKFYFLLWDIVNDATFKEEPLVLLDGVPIFDTDKIMAFDPLKVKKLEVMTKIFFQGQFASAGIVSYSTYTGDLSGFQIHPKSVVQDFEGLQIPREFYKPKYENKEARLSREPDQRNLLLWAPNVKVENGKAELQFYTSDQSGYFQIEIEGLSPSGRMGSATHSFYVKPTNN